MKVYASKEVGFVIASLCRITEQLRWERILKVIKLQLPYSGQGCQPLAAFIYIYIYIKHTKHIWFQRMSDRRTQSLLGS